MNPSHEFIARLEIKVSAGTKTTKLSNTLSGIRLPPNFTHFGPPPLRGRGGAYPLVFPDESPFRTP